MEKLKRTDGRGRHTLDDIRRMWREWRERMQVKNERIGYDMKKMERLASLGIPPLEYWCRLSTTEFSIVSGTAAFAFPDVFFDYVNEYSDTAKIKAERRRRHQAAVDAAKKRQSDPRFRRAEYDLKQACAAIDGFEYQHPSETETQTQTFTRRRKLRHGMQKIVEAARKRQETARFQRQEHCLEHACKVRGVQYFGPKPIETEARTKARRRMLRRKLAKAEQVGKDSMD